MKVKKWVPGKFYHVKWLDHATCYPNWTKVEVVEDTALECFSVGIMVKETHNSIYLAINAYVGEKTYGGMMQILKSTITYSKVLK